MMTVEFRKLAQNLAPLDWRNTTSILEDHNNIGLKWWFISMMINVARVPGNVLS